MTSNEVLMREACRIQSAAELKAFDAMAEDNFQIPFFLKKKKMPRKGRIAAGAIIAACLLFATGACASWPIISVKILCGKAYLMTEDAENGNTPFRKFTFSSLPDGCELQWNQTEGYYSCTIQRGGERFTVVQYPLEHRAQIMGDNADGTVTQNDLDGIEQDCCTLSNVEDLTETILETYSVVSWTTEDCYFVSLNDTWTDYASMKAILQQTQS